MCLVAGDDEAQRVDHDDGPAVFQGFDRFEADDELSGGGGVGRGAENGDGWLLFMPSAFFSLFSLKLFFIISFLSFFLFFGFFLILSG